MHDAAVQEQAQKQLTREAQESTMVSQRSLGQLVSVNAAQVMKSVLEPLIEDHLKHEMLRLTSDSSNSGTSL